MYKRFTLFYPAMKTRALRLGWFSLFCSYCLASSLLVAQGTQSQNQTEGETPTYKAAVIVENRVGDILEDRVRSFEDRIIASVTGNGLSVISREDVLSGLKETN